MGHREEVGAARRAATRERILDAATWEWQRLDTVAGRRGEWPGVRVADIAARAGVAVSTVYVHFHSHGVLAAHVLRRAFEEDLFRWVQDDAPGLPSLDALVEAIHRISGVFGAHRAATATLLMAIDTYTFRFGAPTGAKEDPRTPLPLPDLLSTLLSRCQADGTIRTDVAASDSAAGLLNALILRAHTRPQEAPEASAQLVLDLLLDGLRPR